MSDLRKLMATALTSSNLGADENEERAIDRILALGSGDRLGTLLWRLRLANDHTAFKQAALVLSSRMVRAGEARSMREKVAERAVMEWLDDVCKICLGRGRLVPKNSPVATHTCTGCEGTGRARHSDAARARALGIPMPAARKWEARFAKAHALISAADRATYVTVARQLGRTRAETPSMAGGSVV